MANSREEMIDVAEQWRPYQSIASLYIWRSLDGTPEADA